jgi:hypothetical protein
VDEMTKNISKRNIISVIDDIENDASTLVLLFKAMVSRVLCYMKIKIYVKLKE